MPSPAIETESLTKDYGAFRALDALTLVVQPGEIFGLLGPNGAGKTTTIRLLMGMLVPTAGRARLCGLDCHGDRVEAKTRVGYLPDDPKFHDYLRGREILRFVGHMHGLSGAEARSRAEALLGRFGLLEAADDYAVNYSKGMKAKLGLACAMIHDPDVFILDEPTNGLDPGAARDVQDWIVESARGGKTVLLSTHLLEMAERLCHRVGIIDKGRLAAVGTPAELKDRFAAGGTLEQVFLAVTRDGGGERPGQGPA
ncbi:MAG: ABC transporter ATP-binding protein [Planctomycetia bacterium]|nr:ABC transporter ATP-binding protein [Planctomycetia bacterium]